MLPRPVSPRQKRLVPIARRTGSQGAPSAAGAPSLTAGGPARAPPPPALPGGARGEPARAGGAHGREVEDHVAALRALDQPRRAGGAEDDRLDDAQRGD